MSAGVRISVPIALLIVGVALSCSTACITSAVVGEVAYRKDQRKQMAELRRQLESNVRSRGGTLPVPPLASDPAAIREALQLGMPQPLASGAGNRRLPDKIDVTVSLTDDGRTLYLVTARGNFGSLYDEVFLEYADAVRRRVQPIPVFRVTLVMTYGQPHLSRELR